MGSRCDRSSERDLSPVSLRRLAVMVPGDKL